MIAMITTHNSNYYRLKILVTHMDFVITFVILATLKNYDWHWLTFQLRACSHPSGLLVAPNYETMKV